jgi:hypothetical protein
MSESVWPLSFTRDELANAQCVTHTIYFRREQGDLVGYSGTLVNLAEAVDTLGRVYWLMMQIEDSGAAGDRELPRARARIGEDHAMLVSYLEHWEGQET